MSDNYELNIETLTTEYKEDLDIDSDDWRINYQPNLGKVMIEENWMLSLERVGDCQTLVDFSYVSLFWDSVEDAISYIIGEYQTNTKAIQKVTLDGRTLYEVGIAGPWVHPTWVESFSPFTKETV